MSRMGPDRSLFNEEDSQVSARRIQHPTVISFSFQYRTEILHLLRKLLRGDVSYIIPGHRTGGLGVGSGRVPIGRVDAIKCIRRMARSRNRERIGPFGRLRDEGIEATGMTPHATLFEVYLPCWNVKWSRAEDRRLLKGNGQWGKSMSDGRYFHRFVANSVVQVFVRHQNALHLSVSAFAHRQMPDAPAPEIATWESCGVPTRPRCRNAFHRVNEQPL